MTPSFTQALEEYQDHIKASYTMRCTNESMIARFNESARLDVGSKYIKVVFNGSVHSFIVQADGPTFKRGDILKAASWKSPALNFSRGNILNKSYGNVSWTGA